MSVVAAGNDSSGLLIIALGHGLALMAGIYAFGAISGAHFNPTVTIALVVSGRVPWREVPGYITTQLVGGVFAAYLTHLVYGQQAIDAGLARPRSAPASP